MHVLRGLNSACWFSKAFVDDSTMEILPLLFDSYCDHWFNVTFSTSLLWSKSFTKMIVWHQSDSISRTIITLTRKQNYLPHFFNICFSTTKHPFNIERRLWWQDNARYLVPLILHLHKQAGGRRQEAGQAGDRRQKDLGHNSSNKFFENVSR